MVTDTPQIKACFSDSSIFFTFIFLKLEKVRRYFSILQHDPYETVGLETPQPFYKPPASCIPFQNFRYPPFDLLDSTLL